MERSPLDARPAPQALAASTSAAAPASRGPNSLFPASGTHERTLPANPTLASFPHEDVEPMRVHANVSSASNGVTVTATSTDGAGYVILPRWSPSPLTPRYLATHPPPPLGPILTSTTAGGSSMSDGNDTMSHYSLRNSVHSVRVEPQLREVDQPTMNREGLNGSSLENVGAHGAAPGSAVSGMTMSAALAAIPSIARPLAATVPMTTHTGAALPTKKRKRPSGASRLRNFLCTHPGCGKSFTDSAHLRDHRVVHTGEKNLSCSLCEKRFARASSLREHQRVHTGEKPYVCAFPQCGKCYSSRAALRFHVSSHLPRVNIKTGLITPVDGSQRTAYGAGIVPFVCQECGKHFRVRELLMAHRKVHDAHRAAAASAANAAPSPQGPTPSLSVVSAAAEDVNTGVVPASNENRQLQETIRAQQLQIEQLKAEVTWLRQQASQRVGEGPSTAAPPVTQNEAVEEAIAEAVAPPPAMKPEPRALTAPVEMLRDGVKPFECCICHNRFANFYQLTFHGKQHPDASAAEVTGSQAPLPVGPKYCPEEACEYAESTGKSLRNLQTLKRHWQRRHQTGRPYACLHCPPTHQKTFKTRENLKAHEKDCMRNLAVR